MKKIILASALILALISLVGCGKQESSSSNKKDAPSPNIIKKNDTNKNAAIYSLDEQQEVLKKFPNLYRYAFDKQKEKREFGTYVIPGLITTKTKLLSENNTFSMSQHMTPQGVTVTKDSFLITAYDHMQKHHSVVYVLNKKTGKLENTIVLEGHPHVGGITYDPIFDTIWIASYKDNKAQVVALAMKDIKNYEFDKIKYQPIAYKQAFELPDLDRASFLTYQDGFLYVGDFFQKKDGIVKKYEITPTGELTEDKITTTNVKIENDSAVSEGTDSILKDIQGITFYKGRALLSQSYGKLHSKIYILDSLDNDKINLDKDALAIIKTPRYLEQITANDDNLYAIFESGSYQYREKDFEKVDRVLQLNLKKFFEDNHLN